ncbi:MAG: hypothetical protein DMG85_05740 [Acidobacteria bacterium]|nr:MAG: hypothetical protein DMG85_05740 [Acidobacteriota bacterium]
MRIQQAFLIISLAVSTVLVGCVGRVRYPTYYTLNVPPAPDPPAAAGLRASLAIREFRSPVYLRQGPLVYRASAEQIGFYDYHRWATDPRQFVTTAIADRLRASGNFADVSVYDGRSHADFIITGCLEKLEEVDYEGGVKVEVALSAQMTDIRTGTTVWASSVSDIENVAQRNVPAVVSEMNHSMERTIEKLVSSIPRPAPPSR